MAKRKADKLAGPGSFADMLKRKRKAIEAGDLQKAQKIGQDFAKRKKN